MTNGKGYQFSASIEIPEGGILVAIYHTHPSGAMSQYFSQDDTTFAELNDLASYIGVQDKKTIIYFDPMYMDSKTIKDGSIRLKNVSKGENVCRNCF